MKGPSGSRADRHVRFGVSHDTVVLPKLLGDRLPQFWQAIKSRVDILALLHRLCPGPKHHRWNRRIADPLRHVETLRLETGLGHRSNLRMGQCGHSLVEVSFHRHIPPRSTYLSCRRPIPDRSSLLSRQAAEEIGSDTIANYEVFVTYKNQFAILRSIPCRPLFRATPLEEGGLTAHPVK